MLDAVDVLLRAGIVHAAFLQARAALEASLYIDWILLGDSERKADCYVVATLRHERLWALRASKGTPEAKALDEITATLDLDMHGTNPSLDVEAGKHLIEINRILEQAGLKALDNEFDQVRKKRKRNFDPEWYVPAGAATIRHIAKDVGRLPQYVFCYSKGSYVTHSALYKDQVQFKKKEVRFRAIRSLKDVDELLTTTMPVFIGTYQRIVRVYRSGEEKSFARHYLENWQKPFQSIKRVVLVEGKK